MSFFYILVALKKAVFYLKSASYKSQVCWAQPSHWTLHRVHVAISLSSYYISAVNQRSQICWVKPSHWYLQRVQVAIPSSYSISWISTAYLQVWYSGVPAQCLWQSVQCMRPSSPRTSFLRVTTSTFFSFANMKSISVVVAKVGRGRTGLFECGRRGLYPANDDFVFIRDMFKCYITASLNVFCTYDRYLWKYLKYRVHHS